MTIDQPLGLDLPTEVREREYSPSSRLPNADLTPYLERYRADSDRAAELHRPQTITYGPLAANTVDVVVPEAATKAGSVPLHVFIHGGYWQQLTKADSFFLAPDCVERGMAFAAVDYTLAPDATVDQIVNECCAAMMALRDGCAELGIDADVITVSGSSAGAHLALMSTLRLSPDQRPAGLVLVSGVYLLAPLIGTSINDALGLTPESARAVSPLLFDLGGLPPTVVAYGDNETDEFKRHSRALTRALGEAGVAATEVEVSGRNHFDIVHDIMSGLFPNLPPAV